MTSVAGLQRGDLVFIAGTRADWALHAKVILIEKAPKITTAPPAAAPTTTPSPTATSTTGRTGNHS